MLIVCPNCAATYQVSTDSIGTAGRDVRCVRCRTVWREMPSDEAPALAAPPIPEAVGDDVVAAFRAELTAGANQADHGEPDEPPANIAQDSSLSQDSARDDVADAASLDALPDDAVGHQEQAEAAVTVELAELAADETPALAPIEAGPKAGADIETTASRKPSRGRKRQTLTKGPLPGAIVGMLIAIAALIVWRGTVVRYAPQTASLYRAIGLPVNLRGLAFKEIQIARDTNDGVPVLVVEGTVVSAASAPIEVPRLRFAMQDENGREIYAWTAMPAQAVLQPGETMPFRSRLASPPAEGKTVVVRFFTLGDATAGLR